MKIKPCLYYLGLSCFPISLMALINIFYSFYFDYLVNIYSYLTVLVLSLIVGLIFFRIGKTYKDSITIYEQLLLIFLVYFFISLFISIPYYISNYQISFVNSYFESISGLTGTGFTIFEYIKSLDQPLLLWRSSSQWIGGLYFLIFLVLIFSNKQINYKLTDLLFNLEKKTNLNPNLLPVANRIFVIYLFLSFIIFFLFFISGVRLFDSLNLTMTIVSSGGFLPTDSLNQIITNNFQSIILCLSFMLTILNFYLFYNLILNRNSLKEHKEDFYLVILIIIFSMFFFLIDRTSLISVFINVLSSISTSGISTVTVKENFTLYFIILTIVGGSVFSTTSGIKFLRIYILIKGFVIEIYKLVKPNVVLNTKIMLTDKRVNTINIKMSFLIFILFFLSLFILSSILLIDFFNFESSFKLSILTLTNTAASNIYGLEEISFANLFTFTKISLIIFMVIAKVELLAIFILIQKVFFKD